MREELRGPLYALDRSKNAYFRILYNVLNYLFRGNKYIKIDNSFYPVNNFHRILYSVHYMYDLLLYLHMVYPYQNSCETWSLTLNKECRLSVFENRILKQIFGPKRDENGEWRRLHSLYRSSNIVRVIKSRKLRWAGHVSTMEEDRIALKFLTGTPTGKKPIGRPRR